jgi:hypothetical protein
MSFSTPAIHVPDSRPTFPAWLRSHLGWMFVAMVVLATAVLGTVVVLDGGSTADRVGVAETPVPVFDADRGSITAIERRAVAGADTPGLYDRGSITAIERRAVSGAGG